ncbi:MAG: pyridoxal phosphate-dependent aminotransferase [Spirochaetota bacterium]
MQFAERILQIKPSPTLEISALANALKAKGIDVIGFGTGEPDFDTPAHIKEAAIRAIEMGKTKYTEVGGIIELKKAIVNKFARDNALEYKTSEIIVNCGGKHSFYNLMQVLLNPGDEVIIPAPYWVSYPPMVSLADGTPVIIQAEESHGFKITPKQLADALTSKTRAIVLCSPSNPTGSVYTPEELRDLAAVVGDRDILWVSDDMYESILYTGKPFVNIAMISPELKEKTVVLNGTSKAYAMTGWRIGYMAGNEALIKKIDIIQSQSTSNPCSISQYAAVEALNGNQAVIGKMVSVFARRRETIVSGLNSVPGISCLYPDGAFYAYPNVAGITKLKGWNAISEKYSSSPFLSSKVTAFLLEEARVAVVPGVAFGTDEHVRLSFATSDDHITEGVSRIKTAIEKLA